MDIKSQKEKIAIVVVGYNRLKAIARLLDSLNKASYPDDDIPLVISIDASGDEELYNYVSAFEWMHGTKSLNIQKERLGLKKHIFQCFSLSKFFKGVIILEDDIFVSPFFYHYAESTLDKYGDEDKVAGIALYSNEVNGYKGLPFQPMNSSWDVFAWQTACSWGEMLNERMWNNFSMWMEQWDGNRDAIDMNSTIKGWSRAWSVYMYAFMVKTDRYFIYPYMPVTTNFNDAGGEHGGGEASIVQVSLLQGERNYQLGNFEELVCYDIYSHNMAIAGWLGLKQEELTIDYFGQRDVYYNRYVLTTFDLPFRRVRGFRHVMRPWELNIKYGLEGNEIILYDRGTTEPYKTQQKKFSYEYLMYYFERYKMNITLRMVLHKYWIRLKNKFK